MKHKQALIEEIAMFRRNAKDQNGHDFERMVFSEWPLCANAKEDCSDFPIALHTGKTRCHDCQTGDASWVWACYQKGVVELPTISKALTAAMKRLYADLHKKQEKI